MVIDAIAAPVQSLGLVSHNVDLAALREGLQSPVNRGQPDLAPPFAQSLVNFLSSKESPC